MQEDSLNLKVFGLITQYEYFIASKALSVHSHILLKYLEQHREASFCLHMKALYVVYLWGLKKIEV